MPPKYLGFAIFVYVLAIIFSSISSGQDLFANPAITDSVQATQIYGIVQYKNSFIQTINPIAIGSYFSNMWKVLTLDFPFFHEGPWIIFRWIILAPIIGIIVYGIIASFAGFMQRQV